VAKLADKQQKANKKYYSKKGKAIYSDFLTFAKGKALAKCNAIEFSSDFSANPPPVICEYGVGNGNFAKIFLDELKKRNFPLYSKVNYHLFDFSQKMLTHAKKNLSKHRKICKFHKFDALHNKVQLGFDYCRINELLSDLSAQIYLRKGKQVFELVERKGAFDMDKVNKPNPQVSKFLERIDSGRAIPFNFNAQKFLSSLCKKGKSGFRIDIFDYGFYSADDVLLLPLKEWNRLVLRNYGGQITVDLNFLQIISQIASQNLPFSIEKQKDYAEQVLGFPLKLRQTKNSLDYEKAKTSRIKEDDGFFHLRIGR